MTRRVESATRRRRTASNARAWLACAALSLAFLAVGPSVVTGAAAVELRGYLKEAPVSFRDPLTGERAWNSDTRLRLKLRSFVGSSLTLVSDGEAQLQLGSGGDFTQRLGGGSRAQDQWLDLSWQPIDEEHARLRDTLDRLYAQWYSPKLVVTAGRQRIAWGVCSWLSPLDLFAPFAPIAIDTEEKLGVDALDLSVPLGDLSNLELVVSRRGDTVLPAPLHLENPASRQRAGLRWRGSWRGWDLSIVGAGLRGATAAGASASGAVGGTGLRGELLYWHEGLERLSAVAGNPLALRYRRTNFVQASLDGEHGFRWRNLTLQGELHFDGSGSAQASRYDLQGLAAGDRITLARWYAAASVQALVTPLLTARASALTNLDDGSSLFQPELERSLTTNLELRAGAQLGVGATRSEYGAVPDLIYAVLARYF